MTATRVPMTILVLALVSIGVAGGVAFSSSNTLPKSSSDYSSKVQGVNDIKPAECTATLAGIVTGSGSFAGTAAAELILGSPGADVIDGGGGADCILGGGGGDELRGDAGNDVMFGGPGDDRVRGGDDDDALYGGTGTDECRGENGTDTFPGGDCEDIQQ